MEVQQKYVDAVRIWFMTSSAVFNTSIEIKTTATTTTISTPSVSAIAATTTVIINYSHRLLLGTPVA